MAAAPRYGSGQTTPDKHAGRDPLPYHQAQPPRGAELRTASANAAALKLLPTHTHKSDSIITTAATAVVSAALIGPLNTCIKTQSSGIVESRHARSSEIIFVVRRLSSRLIRNAATPDEICKTSQRSDDSPCLLDSKSMNCVSKRQVCSHSAPRAIKAAQISSKVANRFISPKSPPDCTA